MFTREDGSALHPATVTDRFQATSAAAGLPPIQLHDLRHGAASLMLAAGVPMKVVQETLGHSSIRLTRRHLHLDLPAGGHRGSRGRRRDRAVPSGSRSGCEHTASTRPSRWIRWSG